MLNTTPRIYVGTFAKYNNGSIGGAWLDLEDYSDADTFYEACVALHADESDPEFMFQDFEGIPSGMVSESGLKAEFWDWVDLDDSEKELLSVYLTHVDQEGTLEDAQDKFAGRGASPEDWAESFADETGLLESVPDNLKGYFNWTQYARDCEFAGMTFARVNGETWVFYV